MDFEVTESTFDQPPSAQLQHLSSWQNTPSLNDFFQPLLALSPMAVFAMVLSLSVLTNAVCYLVYSGVIFLFPNTDLALGIC